MFTGVLIKTINSNQIAKAAIMTSLSVGGVLLSRYVSTSATLPDDKTASLNVSNVGMAVNNTAPTLPPNLKIVQFGDPVSNKLLKSISSQVTSFDNALKELAYEMLAVVREEKGRGLAAIQVGEPTRLLVIDYPRIDPKQTEPLFVVNAQIVSSSRTKILLPEGCFSVRGQDGKTFVVANIYRPDSATIKYQDLDANWHTLSLNSETEPSKWLLRCLLHEMSHWEGETILDYIMNKNQGAWMIGEVSSEPGTFG